MVIQGYIAFHKNTHMHTQLDIASISALCLKLMPGATGSWFFLEDWEAACVLAAIPLARERGQVRDGRMAWRLKGHGWMVFRNSPDGLKCFFQQHEPTWLVKAPREKLVPIMVPASLEKAMRAHLGALVNPHLVQP